MATLRELTDAAGIEHVVWVDDLFDEASHRGSIAADVELRELAARLVERKGTVTIGDRTLGPDHTIEEWVGDLEDLQEAGAEVDAIRAALNHALGTGDVADYSETDISSIIASFGAERVTTIGSAGWPALHPMLPVDRRTLLVVDREFAVNGTKTTIGEQILQDVVRKEVPKFHVVMLTRSVEQDSESLRTELAARLEIPRHKFEVTAKTVSDDERAAEASLCGSFQRIFTHQVCMQLTQSIHSVMVKDLESAVDTLASESVYDLDRVVFQNSLEEGASELDVLTRILLLRQRVAVDRALAAYANYFDQLTRLRALRQVGGALVQLGRPSSSLIEEWRRDEVCDPGERLNPACAPLSCGDVFVRSGSSDVFLLLGQPCDLMVRPTGFRATHEAIFVRVEKHEGESQAFHYLLQALPLQSVDQWRLDLRKWASVNLRLLDFAVFSANGAVRLNVTVDPPDFLLPGSKKLLERAKAKIRGATVAPHVPNEYAYLSLSSELKQTAATRTGDELALAYSRVGRLRAPWAVAAFAAFTSYQARAAFDHDFAKALPETGPH